MKSVSLFMDVEDPVNPLADDAALDFPLLFSDQGVRGSFCLTGEKCRTLKARGRQDVIDAYKPHCLGLHTNAHSFHPTTMELLADLGWEEGCRAALEVERQGFDAFTDIFGRAPSFWGGGGNTWSPEITDAMKHLGIPAYVYALTQFPNEAVHKFNDVIAMPQAFSISEGDWSDDERAPTAVGRTLAKMHGLDQPWIGLFVGHPTKFRYEDWWDVPYYGGRTPPTPEFGVPVPDDRYARGKANLHKFLGSVQSEFKVVGVDEALNIDWQFRTPTPAEMSYYDEHTPETLRGARHWPPHRKDLDPELIVQKTMALSHTLRVSSR